MTSGHNQYLNLNTLAASLARTFAWAGCLKVALGPAFWAVSVLRAPSQLLSSRLWVDLSPVSPQAKTGTLLSHRQQEVNLKEVHKAGQVRLRLTSTHLRSIFGRLLEGY